MKNIQSVKGFNDVLPSEIKKSQTIEKTITQLLNTSGFSEIRTPIIEYTELYQRSIGDETDIVSKEMYSIKKGEDTSITLRPEGTVGVARALLENSLLQGQQKLWYNGYMFRAENTQKGRYRQFQQIGVEVYGISDPRIEIELIYLTQKLWQKLNVFNLVKLQVNSIGDKESRKAYTGALLTYMKDFYPLLDQTTIDKFERNPLRILDTKDLKLKEMIKDAPKIIDYLNEASFNNFNYILKSLSELGVDYEVNYNLVRGLDYYNDFVFEWITNDEKSQNTICAGGRYDGLIDQLGGRSTPAVGFAMGIERLIILINENSTFNIEKNKSIYICPLGEETYVYALQIQEIISQLNDWTVIINAENTSLKSQLKKADKYDVEYSIIIGSNELLNREVTIKDMKNGTEQLLISERDLLSYFKEK